MSLYQIKLAKEESRTPLFYYPYHIELKSEFAKYTVARYFYSKRNSYVLSMQKKDMELMLNEENLKELSGKYTFHYDDPTETEGRRIAIVMDAAPKSLGRRGINGFIQFLPNMKSYGARLEEGEDFNIIVGERVEIEQPTKLTFDDIPDLMGVEDK